MTVGRLHSRQIYIQRYVHRADLANIFGVDQPSTDVLTESLEVLDSIQ